MKRKLLDILACPAEGYFPLNLHIFEEDDEVISGILVCPNCLRWYPIREKIPEMLPDKLRDITEETNFLNKWKKVLPNEIREKYALVMEAMEDKTKCNLP